MNLRPPQPLDAEERALAKALPRLHGRTAPGPDLDSSILAAAEAAVRPAKPRQAQIRPRVRWIAPAALAASMVLAVGMAWHLRPLPALDAAQPAAQSEPSNMSSVRMIEPASNTDSAPMLKSAAAEPTAPTREQSSSPAVDAPEIAPPVRTQSVQAPVPLRTPSTLPVPPPPPPPAPPVPDMPAQAAPRDAASTLPTGNTLETQAGTEVMRARAAGAAASMGANGIVRDAPRASTDKAAQPAPIAPLPHETRNKVELADDAGFVDDPGVDIPPATAASPAVRDAWLHRIGELLKQGKRQEAKASLAEFRRRYPAAVLPPALHALEIEP